MKRRIWIWSMVIVYVLVLSGMVLSAAAGSRAVRVMALSERFARRTTVVIDAGHGGEDGGATSCTGVLESRINLEISLRLRDLMALLGIPTKMIRTTDTAVYTQGETIAAKKVSDLKQRANLVKETENALLISIHQNQFPESRYWGGQVFYASTDGSKALAEALQSSLVQVLNPGSKRKCKPSSGVYLMEHIDCPGILVECGFLSNPEEEARLRSPEYQRKLCCVISAAVSQYLP